jgi:hypothetical protein
LLGTASDKWPRQHTLQYLITAHGPSKNELGERYFIGLKKNVPFVCSLLVDSLTPFFQTYFFSFFSFSLVTDRSTESKERVRFLTIHGRVPLRGY